MVLSNPWWVTILMHIISGYNLNILSFRITVTSNKKEIPIKQTKVTHTLRRILNIPFVLLIFIYILFEEFIWNTAVKPIIHYIASFHFYQRFLDYVRLRAGRFSVLILFMIPFALGEVIGTLSAIMATKLHLYSAALLYTMKIPLIVVALGILQSGKEKLLSFGWFALCYTWVITQIDKLHASRLYQQVHITINQTKSRFFNRSSYIKRWTARIYRRIRYSITKKEMKKK
jgi:hypothetical protein